MGRGIAYASALGGYRTILEDVMPEMLTKARAWIAQAFDEGAKRGKLAAEEAAVALKRISTASSVEDACRESDFLIEAVPEEMELSSSCTRSSTNSRTERRAGQQHLIASRLLKWRK